MEKGLVCESDCLYQLSAQGAAVLKLTQVLVSPVPLLSLEMESVPGKRSSAALLHFLIQDGWTLQHVKGKQSVPAYGPFTVDNCAAPKTLVIRESRKTLDREYMLSLVLAQDSSHRKKLLDIGITSVEHLMPAAFYSALNKAEESALQAVLMQADAGEDMGDWAMRVQRVRQAWRKPPGFRLDASFRWGCVSFKGTRKKLANDGGVRLGYECSCPRKSHTTVSATEVLVLGQ